jgi:hypothetical protein
MHTTKDFVSLLQQQISAEMRLPAPASYYRVAANLEISETAVLRWKDGKGTMSDGVALKVANRLQMPEAYVMACIRAERERDPAVLRVWEAIAAMCGKNAERYVGKVMSILLVSMGMMAHFEDARSAGILDVSAQALAPAALPSNQYYVKLNITQSCPLRWIPIQPHTEIAD